tara:strand:+ start:3607 stop:5232 length:1626 start_codon:yes stop_codon:yes gene_type:complete
MSIYKKFIDLYQKTLYVSRLTSVKNKKRRILFSVLLSNGAVILDVLIIVSFSTLLTEQISYSNQLIVNLITYITSSIFFLPLMVVLRFVFLFYEKLNIETLSLDVAESLRLYLMKEVFQKGNLSISDSYYYITQVSVQIANFYRSFATFINSSIQILGYSFFLLITDSQVFSIFFIGALSLIFPTNYLIRKGKHYQHVSFIEAKNVNSYIQRIIDNMFLIKILKTISFEFNKFIDVLKKFTFSQRSNIIFGSLNSILPTFSTLFILSILFTSSSFVKNISIEFIGVLLRLFQSLSAFNNGLNLVINSSVHVEELYKLDKNSPEVKKNNYVVDEQISNAVEFHNVDFSYFNSKTNIFEKLNLKFEKNSHTIITGPNGSGKSTVLGLISGLYLPVEGEVKICSDKLGYIGVTPLIIEGSIRENLLYGNEKSIDDKEMYELLDKFSFFPTNNTINLDEIINNKSLSSGQMQKISFIRSLLNKSSILLLDEATSNLDEKTKSLIFEILNNEEITIINSTHNKEDFKYDLEMKIEIIDNSRLIKTR